MKLRNREVAAVFERLADLLEIEGDNPFRVRAYRNAAGTIAGLPAPIGELIADGTDLTQYPHIGREIADKLHTIAETGRLPALDAVGERVPPALADLMTIEGLGPKGVKAIYDHFHVGSLDELEQLARAGSSRARGVYASSPASARKRKRPSSTASSAYAPRATSARVSTRPKSKPSHSPTTSPA